MAKNDLPDGKKIIQRILDLLKLLIEAAERVGVPVPQQLKDDFHKYDDEYRTIKSRKKLSIAVAGKFSSGKSKFLNSLLGINIAPVNIERTTRCRTVFTHEPSLKLKAGEIRIFDSHKKIVTEDAYRKLAAKASSKENAFTIFVSDPFWKDVELIDTPGFDPPKDGNGQDVNIDDCSDASISRDAVAKAEVVFFLCDSNKPTIEKDSAEYIKTILEADNRKKLYIIINKADLKSEEVLKRIEKSIEEECCRLGIGCERILRYCSLVDGDSVLEKKPPKGREKALILAASLREMAKKRIIDKLVLQAQGILAARNREKELGLKKDLKRLTQECVNEVIRTKERRLKDIADDDHIDIESLTASIVKLLLEKAEWYTREGLSNLIKCQELKEPGIFRKDWFVYVGDPDDETYMLSGDDYRVLSSHISTFLHDNGFKSDTTLRDKIISLFRSCSNITIDQYKTDDGDNELLELQAQEKSDFRKRCNREADCLQAEEEIGKNILACFPDDFENACSPKVTEAIEQAVSEIKDQQREALQRTFEQCDDCIDQLSKRFPADTEDEEPLRHPSNGSNNTQKLVKEILDSVDWAELWNKMKKGCASAWQKFRALIKKGDNHVTQ